MQRTRLVVLVALVVGIAVGAGGHALFFSDDDKTGIYCYHPNSLNPFKTTCIRRGGPDSRETGFLFDLGFEPSGDGR